MTALAAEQTSFDTNDFANNPEPRCQCVLLLGVSSSMAGTPISALTRGLQSPREDLAADTLANKRVELAVVTFSPVQLLQPLTTAADFEPPAVIASGDAPMGPAITQALEQVRARKAVDRSNGISYYRPWIFLITDGAPIDPWPPAAWRRPKPTLSHSSRQTSGRNQRPAVAGHRSPITDHGSRITDHRSPIQNHSGGIQRD